MGAMQFKVEVEAETPEDAFRSAVLSAQFEYGLSGYTGTIAEKDNFIYVSVPSGVNPDDVVHAISEYDDAGYDKLVNLGISRTLAKRARDAYDDKWGPAVCVLTEPRQYTFFGWASS